MRPEAPPSSIAQTVRKQAAEDPRAVANLILDLADSEGVAIGHIRLQKLLYFVHGLFLIQTGRPLISGHFEAWQYGPVHPAVYRAFKAAGSGPIKFRGEREDIMTGKTLPIPSITDALVKRIALRVVDGTQHLSDAAIVKLSHVKDGPWHFVAEQMKNGVALGARIDHDTIRARFFRHKWVVEPATAQGEGSSGTKRKEATGVEKPITAAY